MKKNKSKISGLSILEALVSTAIVGIGFIAILQMTNFSAQSIDNSGDRTKANYLTEMIAEDVISSRDSLYGVKSDNSNIVFKDGWEATLDCENITDSDDTDSDDTDSDDQMTLIQMTLIFIKLKILMPQATKKQNGMRYLIKIDF